VKIPELGCGPGATPWYIAKEGNAAYGIDRSTKAITTCRLRLNPEVPAWQGELSVGDVSIFPYDDNVFDAVFDSECLYANLYDDARRAYQQIERALRSSGKLLSKLFASRGRRG
jgi:SAM-dependent methyltransferase